MKTLFAFALATLTLASTQAFAGAANADIHCQSADGKLTLEGNVPGDLGEFDLTIQADGRSSRIYSVVNQTDGHTEENASISVVENLELGVWTLKSNRYAGEYGYLEMYALPKSVQFKHIRNGHTASFKAKASVSQPELGGNTQSATLTCSLKYEI